MAEFLLRLRRGSRKMNYLVDQYRKAHPDEGKSVRSDLVAEWAIEERLWRPVPVSPIAQLTRLISRSMRETYMFDPDGVEVRANLPVIEEVMTSEGVKRRSRWFPLFDTPTKAARNSFSLRRRLALADVMQLHFDFMSYNEHNHFGTPLEPLDYNFAKDVEEMSHPTTYQEPESPEEEEEDEEE